MLIAPDRTEVGPPTDTCKVTAADLDVGDNTTHATVGNYAADQTVAVDVPGAGTYEYDDNGNRVRFNAADGSVQRCVYDRENRLTTIYYDATASNPRSEFDYDGLGRRIATREYDSGGSLTSDQNFIYDGLDMLEIRDGSDDTLAHIVHGPGIDNPLALVEFNPSTGAETGRFFYHTDHLGSVRFLTDDSGPAVVVRTYDYSAYGRIISESGSGAALNPFHYTAREFHSESGLYFYRARFYDPAVGQFISADPVGLLAGVNVYAYVQANPQFWRDPFGLVDGMPPMYQDKDSVLRSPSATVGRAVAKTAAALARGWYWGWKEAHRIKFEEMGNAWYGEFAGIITGGEVGGGPEALAVEALAAAAGAAADYAFEDRPEPFVLPVPGAPVSGPSTIDCHDNKEPTYIPKKLP